MSVFDKLFKRDNKEAKPPKQISKRSFKGALPSRFTNWLYSSFMKVNADTNANQITLLARCRELAKNNTIVRSWLTNIEKNVIGDQGFVLQSQVKTGNELDTAFNDRCEWEWWSWMDPIEANLTVDGQLGGQELDRLILRTLLIDGEVFIRVRKNQAYPLGVKFEIIDGMAIDFTKIREAGAGTNAIVLGIEIAADGRPLFYHIKTGNSTIYCAGKEEKIPASEVIHLMFHEFPGQVRGISPLNACLEELKNLDDYAISEIMASKIAAVMGLCYERNSLPQQGDFMDAVDDDDPGQFVQSLEPRSCTNRAHGLPSQAAPSQSSTFRLWRIQQSCLEESCIITWRKLQPSLP